MSNAEHLASVMVEQFIKAVDNGVDLVPVVAGPRGRQQYQRALGGSLATAVVGKGINLVRSIATLKGGALGGVAGASKIGGAAAKL